ncbi:hypothetical protein OJ965_18455 [Pantoea anthophila]|jgi:hypothetical protein|uniref:Uncharacterized protein n=1 Tax=Pantoea anthophila TaxID=470931 RepID=A0ABY2ZGP0_9GAMM|nr:MULTISPECIES: hypothetical protein [Pantoea]KAF6659772.1 hypothetical protein HFD91_11990 [Enterobacteriaceae bacterium EKM102V]TPE16790.1 hypothetical protein FJP62_08430 [Pantoea vagans]KAF6667807.1 hypothetical protein HFD97_11065 [Pantoea sp. EKM103V]KKB05843.1 hypothetical protein TN98_04420 [Pantoea anthophila]MDQ1212445.1 hypothetical protein [Pantoea anthophila]
MKGINIALYFDPDQIQACVHQQDGSYLSKKFEYDDGVIEEIYQWLDQYEPNRTHICLIENETAELLADELVDSGYRVHQVTMHQLLSWFAAEPPASPDGTPMRAMLRFLEEEHPREYESRTPQTEALMEMFDELDALEMVDDGDDEDALPGDLLRAMKKHKITASAAAQRLLPEVNERIREHLMQYPELMTPEILQDFFPELLEALERPKH